MSGRRHALGQDFSHHPRHPCPRAEGAGLAPRHSALPCQCRTRLYRARHAAECRAALLSKAQVAARAAGRFFELPNKSRIWIGGLDDKERVEKILGLEYASIFLNEASQIPYASALVAFTRLAQKVEGLKQRAYVDLNPVAKSHWTNRLFGEKRDPVSMQKLKDPKNYARGFLNPVDNTGNLAPEFLESLANLPERQRKRFYEGVYVDEVEAALWTYEIIETARCDPAIIPKSGRASVVVALDPSGAAGRDDLGADEIGLIVAARGTDGDCYVLADRSCREAPAVWGRRAVTAFHEFRADCIVANRISAARWCARRSRRPIHPDLADTLSVNLAESGGALASTTAAAAAQAVTLMIVDSEFMAYETATLTGVNAYQLTGLYRGLYGSGAVGHGGGRVHSQAGRRGLQKCLPNSYIGQPLYLKFQSFNIFGGGLQDLSDCAAYTFSPAGAGWPIHRCAACLRPADGSGVGGQRGGDCR